MFYRSVKHFCIKSHATFNSIFVYLLEFPNHINSNWSFVPSTVADKLVIDKVAYEHNTETNELYDLNEYISTKVPRLVGSVEYVNGKPALVGGIRRKLNDFLFCL